MWKKILSTSALMLAVRIVAKLATIVTIVMIARLATKEVFGTYAAVLALTAIGGVVADFGLIIPLLRSISSAEGNYVRPLGENLSARFFWSVVIVPILLLVGILMGVSWILVLVFSVSAVVETNYTAMIRSFEGVLEFKKVTWFVIRERAVFSMIVISATLLNPTLLGIALGYLVAAIINVMLSLRSFTTYFRTPKISWEYEALKRTSLIGFPFVLSSVFSALYYRTDVLLLGFFCVSSDVATYNAAMRIIDAQYFIPMAIMTSVFPTLVPIYERQKSIFFQHVWKLLLLFLAAGVGLSLFLWYTASWLLPLLFSAKYASSSEVLQILAFSLVFYFVYYFVSNVLFVMGKEKVFTLVMAISLVGAFLMNAILIPRYGFHVAAQVRCGSEAFIALGLVAALAFSRNQIIRARAVEHGT